MTHLAEQQAVFGIIDEVIPHIACMGVMARNARHITAGLGGRRVLYAADRVPRAGCGAHHVGSLFDGLVTRQAELVDGSLELGVVGAAMGIVADLAHPAGNRAMDIFSLRKLGRLVAMALVAEGCLPFGNCISLCRLLIMAIAAGIGAGRAMDEFNVQYLPMAPDAGVLLGEGTQGLVW